MSGNPQLFFQIDPKTVHRFSQCVVTGKIYPVHNQNSLYLISENKFANSDGGNYYIRCWNMCRKTMYFKLPLKLESNFSISNLSTSNKILFSSKLFNDRIVLGGGINRGTPIVIEPKRRKYHRFWKCININGICLKELRWERFDSETLTVKSETLTPKSKIKGKNVELYEDEMAFYYRNNFFVQLNSTSTFIDDRINSNSFGDLIFIKFEIKEDKKYHLQIINHDKKKILYGHN